MKHIYLCCLSFVLLKILSTKLIVKNAEPLDKFNEHFFREHGWQGKFNVNFLLLKKQKLAFLGADGIYSCKISENVSIWHFAGTFVGERIQNKRTNWTLIRNSAAIEKGILGSTIIVTMSFCSKIFSQFVLVL